MELVHYFGVLLRDASGTWYILNDTGHQSQGLVAVTATPTYLTLTYPTVTKVGSFQITSDETWCGKCTPGASVGLDHALITIRNSAGAIINPLTITGGNFWVDMWGWLEV